VTPSPISVCGRVKENLPADDTCNLQVMYTSRKG
jgi:hypothetical protein